MITIRTVALKGQFIRTDAPHRTAIGAIRPTDRLQIADQYRDRLGKPGLLYVTRGRVSGYADARFLVEDTLAKWDDPREHSAVGAHGPAAEKWAWQDGENYQQVRTARLDVVKILCAGDSDGELVRGIHAAGAWRVDARLYKPLTSKQSGAEAMQEIAAPAMRLYLAGVRYFEVANEPNLYPASGAHEGMGICWKDGAEFADWWFDAVNYLRPLMPDAKFGFPAMSPGAAIPDYRYNPERFLSEAIDAVQAADWLAFHVYWQSDGGEIWALDQIRQSAWRFAHKRMMVTEFANTNPYVDREIKGHQYARFYEGARLLPESVGALDSFVMDSTDPQFESQKWRGSRIAEIVGERVSAAESDEIRELVRIANRKRPGRRLLIKKEGVEMEVVKRVGNGLVQAVKKSAIAKMISSERVIGALLLIGVVALTLFWPEVFADYQTELGMILAALIAQFIGLHTYVKISAGEMVLIDDQNRPLWEPVKKLWQSRKFMTH